MFNIGDFVFHGANGALSIAVTTTIGRVICKRPKAMLFNTTYVKLLFSTKDRIATQQEIELYRNGRVWPKWVSDTLLGIGKQPQAMPVGAVPLTPQGLVDHKPRPAPMPDPLAGRMTLETFQAQCVHKMVTYTGFSRIFKYCVLCDKKENV